MKKRFKQLLTGEAVRYLIFGVLTTIVSIAVYELIYRLGIDYRIAKIVSWAAAVLFAYITNKLFVFESKSFRASVVIREMLSFVACRLASGVADMLILIAAVEYFHMNESAANLLTQAVVVVLNYIFSKLIIFRK